MDPKHTRYFIAIFLVTVLGCKTSEPTSALSPEKQVTGTLSGSVAIVVDSLGNIIDDRSIVHASLDGTSLRANADSIGIWRIGNIPPGTYSVTIGSPGFDPFRFPRINVVAGADNQMNPGLSLVQPPRFVPTLDAFTMPTPSQTGTLYGHFTSDAPAKVTINLLVLSSHRNDLRIEDVHSYDTSYSLALNPYFTTDSSRSFQFGIGYTGTTLSKAKPGDTVSVRVYPFFQMTSRLNPAGDTMVTYGYGVPSNVLTAIKK